MNIRMTLANPAITGVALTVSLALTGCGKKEPEAPPTPTAEQAPAAPAANPASLKSMTDSATKAAESTAKQVNEIATTAAPEVPAGASTPSAEAAKQAETGMAATAASLQSQAAGLQKQATDLLARYSGELSTLKSGVVAIKGYIDKNPDLLSAGVKSKYQELNTLVPQLEGFMTSLKDYQSADLTTLVPKLQADFSRAQTLYSEIRTMLPESL